jgi:predicted SpoU family rRNA methylase
MNSDSVSEVVRQFFGGYFHQDWDLEAEDWQEAVDEFSRGGKPAKLLVLAQEIDTLRNVYDEDELGMVIYRQA